MKNHLRTAFLVTSLLLSSCASVNTAHTPPDGSAERNAILQAPHHVLARQGRKNLALVVPYLKVHNGWAWIQSNPQSSDGTQHTKHSPDFCKRRRRNGHYWNGCLPRKEPITRSTSKT